MKIAIICGGLELGYDGVGDYTRRLAGALSNQGHTVTAIALYDKFKQSTVQGQENADGGEINIVRLSLSIEDAERFKELKAILLKLSPDWVSLQFVPYSFQKKGLPYQFFNNLAGMKLPYKWHIMFHEIWIDQPERKKQYVIKLLQKAIIYIGVKKLKPQVINVTVPYNRQRLEQIGLRSTVLGLFGNIIKSSDSIAPLNTNNSKINILYFGGPPSSEYLEKVLNGLEVFCKKTKEEVNILVVGNNSPAKEFFINILNEKLAAYSVNIKDLGFLEAPELSELLTQCTVGIVRYMPYFIGKSGSAIAMLEHGMPVWLPRWQGKGEVDYEFRKQLIHHDLSYAVLQKHEGYHSLLTEVAKQFINQFERDR